MESGQRAVSNLEVWLVDVRQCPLGGSMSEDFFYPWLGSDFFGGLLVVRFFSFVPLWRVKWSSRNLDTNYACFKMHKLAEKPSCYSVTTNRFIRSWDFPRNLQVTILLVLSRFWKPGGSSLCPWMWQMLNMLSSEKADRRCSWGAVHWPSLGVLSQQKIAERVVCPAFSPWRLLLASAGGCLLGGVSKLYTSLYIAVGILDDRRQTTYDCIVCVSLKNCSQPRGWELCFIQREFLGPQAWRQRLKWQWENGSAEAKAGASA